MKAHYYLMFLVQSIGLAGCCSVENINNVVENAIISCSDSSCCTAKCYRDFIFPTGLQQVSYSCKDGIWTPLLSSCKRLPKVSITYSAQWSFTEILPSKCDNISTRLDDLEEEMVGIFANQCRELKGIHATVQFNYSFLVFKVNVNFTVLYRNYTSKANLDVCINLKTFSFPNIKNFTTMFDGVTCTGSNTNNTISKVLFVSKRLEYCLNGTEVHNVTTSGSGKIEQYCDSRNIFTSDTTPTKATHTTTLSSSSLKTTNLTTEAGFTEKNDYYDTTKSTDHFSRDDIEVESIIYIAAAGGVLLIPIIIILVVCVQKRVKSPETLSAVDNTVYDQSFKGELIENELYQSADNPIDSTGNKGNTKVNMIVSSAPPNCKDLPQTEQELEQDQYSYPSKCKERNLYVKFKDDGIDKLDSNAIVRGH